MVSCHTTFTYSGISSLPLSKSLVCLAGVHVPYYYRSTQNNHIEVQHTYWMNFSYRTLCVLHALLLYGIILWQLLLYGVGYCCCYYYCRYCCCFYFWSILYDYIVIHSYLNVIRFATANSQLGEYEVFVDNMPGCLESRYRQQPKQQKKEQRRKPKNTLQMLFEPRFHLFITQAVRPYLLVRVLIKNASHSRCRETILHIDGYDECVYGRLLYLLVAYTIRFECGANVCKSLTHSLEPSRVKRVCEVSYIVVAASSTVYVSYSYTII